METRDIFISALYAIVLVLFLCIVILNETTNREIKELNDKYNNIMIEHNILKQQDSLILNIYIDGKRIN